jgi:hypothetical protein
MNFGLQTPNSKFKFKYKQKPKPETAHRKPQTETGEMGDGISMRDGDGLISRSSMKGCAMPLCFVFLCGWFMEDGIGIGCESPVSSLFILAKSLLHSPPAPSNTEVGTLIFATMRTKSSAASSCWYVHLLCGPTLGSELSAQQQEERVISSKRAMTKSHGCEEDLPAYVFKKKMVLAGH